MGTIMFSPKSRSELLNAFDEYIKPEYNFEKNKELKNIIKDNEVLMKNIIRK